MGRQGRLDYVNRHLCSPHLSRCPLPPKFTIALYSSPVSGVHRTLSDAWQKLPLVFDIAIRFKMIHHHDPPSFDVRRDPPSPKAMAWQASDGCAKHRTR